MKSNRVLIGAAVTAAAGYAIGDWLARVTLFGERTETRQLHSRPVPAPAADLPPLSAAAAVVAAVPAAYLLPAATPVVHQVR